MEILNASETTIRYRYPNELLPQPAYVWLDCEKEQLRAAYDPNIGGWDSDVHSGMTLRWQIAIEWGDEEIDRLLKELAPLAETVISGTTKTWNGNDWVAVYDEKASEAIDKIAAICEQYEECDNPIPDEDLTGYAY